MDRGAWRATGVAEVRRDLVIEDACTEYVAFSVWQHYP